MLLVHLAEIGAAASGDPSWIPAVSAALSWLPVQTFYAIIQSVGCGEYLIATSCCYLLCGLTRCVLVYSLLEKMDWTYVAPTLAALSSAISYALFFNDLITALYELKAERAPVDEYESYCYSRAGYISRTCFFWLLPLLKSGYRCPLELPDLGAIPRSESLHYRLPIFLASYDRIKDSKRSSSFLWRSFFRCYWKQLLTSGLMKLAGDLVGMIPPLGIAIIIDYVQTQHDPPGDSNKIEYSTWGKLLTNGYVMAGTVLIGSLAQASFSQMSSHILCVQGIRLKACLQGMVYSKVLRVGISRQDDESPLEGNIANLMSEDVANVFTCVSIGHYVWAIPLKIAVLLYLLHTKLGMSAVIGASCCIAVMTPLQFYLGKKMSSNSKLIASWCDERLQKTNEMLQDFRVLKLCCWEMRFSERINQTRNNELKVLDKDSLYWALMTFLTQTSSVLMVVVTLVVYFYFETISLAPAAAFSALALFNQLTVPLIIFPVTVPIIITAMNSIKRLEDFFCLAEVSNVIPESAAGMSHRERKIKIPSEDSVHKVNNEVGGIGSNFNRNDYFQIDETESNVVVIRKAKFSWGDENKPTLSIDHLNIPASKLTVVIGKVGSGKSSLLSALLGEMKCTAGLMMWQKGLQVAYVSQNPWLLNASVRDNILLGLPYNQRRFSRVVIGAALEQDIASLPSRDLTNIGDRGVNLSGGQRQRIAIARALYSRANVLILDDPLSALDCNVAQEVFENGIKKLVTKNGKTVIMVTHSLHLLTNAHQIVALEGGKVKASGKLCDIEVVNGVMTEAQNSPSGRTKSARDRWHLVRLVSRIGHHIRQHSNNYKIKSVFVPLGKAVSGSKRWKQRYWELPLVDSSEDESTRRSIIMRQGSRKNNPVSRASSLQHRSSGGWHGVTRQASTPAINQINRIKTYTFDGSNQVNHGGNLIKNIFNSSSRHFPTDSESKCDVSFKEKNIFRRLIPSTSFRHSMKGEQQVVKKPVQRLPSTCSEYSDDFLDDQDDEEDDWYGSKCSDERQYGQIPIEVYKKYVKCCGIFSSLGYIALATTWQILRVYSDFWLGQWTQQSSTETENQGLYYLTVYTILSLITVIVSLLGSVLGQVCGARARKKLHKDLLESVLRMPVIAFEAFPHARILARFTNDVSIIDKKLASSIQRLVHFLLLCLPAIFVNSVITAWFLLIAIPICIMYYWIQIFYRTSSRELNRLESISRTPILSHLNETVSGLEVIRAFKQQQRFTSTMYTKIDNHTNAVLISNSANRWLGIALDYLGSCIVGAAIVVCLITSWLAPGVVTPALVGVAVNYTLLVPIYLNWVVKFFSEVETNMSAVERLQHYLELPPEDYREKCIMYYGWPQKGEVRFEKVSIKYGIECDSIVNNLDLRILSGQKVGICGRTGSGKSSIVMSLFGVAPVVGGTIYIDDVDISRIPLCILRSRMSIIPQEVILYSGTIRENLDLCNHFTDADLWAALEVAQIKNMVATNLGGLDGMVREGGSNLSLGERQLLCLARAVLHDSALLIMDEATSCLDSTTEKNLLQLAYKAFHNKTVITIAHRLTTLLSCDRILVLESGQIVEDGSPDELLKKSMGIFSTMLRKSETPSIPSK